MDDKPVFDALRTIKGAALTQADVDLMKDALRQMGAAENTDQVKVDPQLVSDLKRDEGLRLKAYKDTVGVWTIGYGHAHVAPGTVWTQAQAEAQLVKDIIKHNEELAQALPWVVRLDPARRRVLQNMAFNLGIGSAARGTGLLGFKNTLALIQAGEYEKAAANMLKSKWAGQVGNRAKRLAETMRTGR